MRLSQYVFIEVLNGPYSAKCVKVGPGEIIQVGRSGKCDLSLPDDALMEGRQLSFTNISDCVLISNLRPERSLTIDSRIVESALLREPTILRCGRTDLLVTWFGPASPPCATSPLVALSRRIAASASPLFLLFAGAALSQASLALNAFNLDSIPVFVGETRSVLAEIAPRIAPIPRDPTVIEWLLRCTWGKHCTVWFASEAEVHALVSSLRQLAAVFDGENWIYFRFFDPRVVNAFLEGSSYEEKARYFGFTRSVILESRSPHQVNHWISMSGGLQATPLDVGHPWQVDLIRDWAEFLTPDFLARS